MEAQGYLCPPPSLAGSGQLRCQIHVARWQITRHYPRCFHLNCLPARFPKPHIRPSTLGIGSHPKASLSGTKDGFFFCIKRKRSSPRGRMLAPSWIRSLRTIGSFSKRKKKSSLCGPYLPGTSHCVEVVRRRTLSQASRKGHRTSSHNGSVRFDTTLSLVISALLH